MCAKMKTLNALINALIFHEEWVCKATVKFKLPCGYLHNINDQVVRLVQCGDFMWPNYMCVFFTPVLWPKASALEEKLLPEQLLCRTLRDLHQPAGSEQPLLSSPGRVPHHPLHLWAQQEWRLLCAGVLWETGGFPVCSFHLEIQFHNDKEYHINSRWWYNDVTSRFQRDWWSCGLPCWAGRS